MRLVDANELEKKLCEDCIGDRVCERRCYEVTMIRGMPTVDAVEHGHWTYERFTNTNGGSYSVVWCSNCQAHMPWVTKYCPNCGAKMDEVTE